MRLIDKVIVHSAATTEDMDIGAEEIRDWHVNGNGWSDIGYHFIIRRDGTVEAGRNISRVGAHTKGHNITSIGICLVGGGYRKASHLKVKARLNFTYHQYRALRAMKIDLNKRLDLIDGMWYGHRDFNINTMCPTFDVRKFIKDGTIIDTTMEN